VHHLARVGNGVDMRGSERDARRMRSVGGAWILVGVLACGTDDDGGGAANTETDNGSTTTGTMTTMPITTMCIGLSCIQTTGTDTDTETDTDSASTTEDEGTTMVPTVCPEVDVSGAQLYELSFTPDEADPEATQALGSQLAFLDTSAETLGILVVYLHGAGAQETCTAPEHGQMLAGQGFHVFSPCYVSDYDVTTCADDIGSCRLEAFEGIDHSDVIEVDVPDSIEGRVVAGLEHLQTINPEGDWTCFLEGGRPRWNRIIISGISHGASTAALIGINRVTNRVVSLSGPLDTGQTWLEQTSLTPLVYSFGFSHTADEQHDGHLEAFDTLHWIGMPTSIDDADPPYDGSHRLITSAKTKDGHSSTQAGPTSPMNGADWAFLPVWQYMYGVP
jgi:hypothetical protein